MYYGTWVNNVTIVGRYTCDGLNGTVNMMGRAPRGAGISGGTAGSDDIPVVSHSHAIREIQTGGTGGGLWESIQVGGTDRTGVVRPTGVSGVNKNVPAFVSLIFIQRIS